jgi:hypothetical protein
VSEKINTKSGATGTVTHDWSTGSIFYHTGMSADFTANITNLPTINDRAYTVTLILIQGATARYANILHIEGTPTPINWQDNTTPTPAANTKEIETLTLIRTGDAWTAFGNYNSYG